MASACNKALLLDKFTAALQTCRRARRYTGVSTLRSLKLSKGVLLTLIFFVLSAFIAIAAFFPVFNKTPFGMPSLLFMAIAIFLIGLQRTRRFSIAKVNFKNGMRFLNLAIGLCAVGTIIYAAYL